MVTAGIVILDDEDDKERCQHKFKISAAKLGHIQIKRGQSRPCIKNIYVCSYVYISILTRMVELYFGYEQSFNWEET